MKITIIALLAIISIATANGRGQCMGRGCGLGFTPVVQVQYDYTTGIESDPTTQGRIYNSTPNTTDIVTRIKYHIPNYGPQTGCRLNFGGPNGTIHGEGNFDFYGTLKEADGQLNTSAFPGEYDLCGEGFWEAAFVWRVVFVCKSDYHRGVRWCG